MLTIPLLATIKPEEIYHELKEHGLNNELTNYQWGSTKDIHTSFYLGHDNHSLYLYFEVKEPLIVATQTEHFSNVFEDSCVEFFYRESDTNNYTNIEINPLGTALVGYGEDRHNRTSLSLEFIQSLAIETTYKRDISYQGSWSVLYHIPMGTIEKDKVIYANAYKCGDLTPKSHYITLFHIDTKSPDFHQSSYFQPLIFA